MDHIDGHSTVRNRAKLSHTARLRIAVCVTALIASAFTMTPAWALRSCPVYPSTIGACCVADQAGQGYQLGNDIVMPSGSCINISARNVVIDLNGFTLLGEKLSGVGVHVLSGAANVAILDGGLSDSMIEGFGIGLKIDAPKSVVLSVAAEFNSRGIVISGQGATVLYSSASGNLGNGITVTPAGAGSYLLSTQTTANGQNGVVLRLTNGVTLRVLTADQNKEDGVWLKGASWNSIIVGELEGNGNAGAYLGCHQGGPNPAACKIPPSEHNSIEGGSLSDYLRVGSCPDGKQANQPYGIVIDKGNGHNHVLGVVSDDNQNCAGPGDIGYDGYDGNGDRCRGNVWMSNNLALVNKSGFYPGCIW